MGHVRSFTAFAFVLLVALLALGVSGCSGDGGGGGGVSEITITITNCDTTTYAFAGVVCVDFTATGPAGTFDLLAQFIGGASGPLEGAYEVPPGLLAQLGLTSNGQNLVLTFNGDTVSGRFCWWVGADLGFVASLGVQLYLTPVNDGTQTGAGPVVSCVFNYGGGGATQALLPNFASNGRAGHCATNVGGKNAVIAGGFNGMGTFSTMNRFSFNTMTFTYSSSASFPMASARRQSGCSFFLDPVTGAIKFLVTGGHNGSPIFLNTADVYCFSPTESVSPTANAMGTTRQNHTATWVPSNKVLIIGGSNQTGPFATMEIYDPLTNSFSPLGMLSFARELHTATLLPSGKVLVAGGVNTSNTALPAEIVDPLTGTAMTVPGPVVDRIAHTATRLANGWVLLAGGTPVAGGPAVSSAQIFQQELGGMGQFTTTMPMMTSPRALHGSSLLGTGDALLTGGDATTIGMGTTSSAELFLHESLTFTPIIPMLVPRAEHSSTALSCGAVAIIGGRNVSTFLGSLEIYPFENTNPMVVSAFTGAAPGAGFMYILASISDADADGGYLVIRVRPIGGQFRLCTIDQQQPSTAANAFPNMEVVGMPNQAIPYSFRWNYAADNFQSGQMAEIEVLPIGATLGTPVRFTVAIP